MKHYGPILLVLLLPITAAAQSGVVVCGGSATSNNHTMSYSLGQVGQTVSETDTYRLTEGLQQELIVEESSIEGVSVSQVVAYPNPTCHELTLKGKADGSTVTVECYSLNGTRLFQQEWRESTVTINLNAFPTGIYLLRVSQNERNSKTFKITKQ